MRTSMMTLICIIALPMVAHGGTMLRSVVGNDPSGESWYTDNALAHGNVGALQIDTPDGLFGCSANGHWRKMDFITAGHCIDGATPEKTLFSTDALADAGFFLGDDSRSVANIVPHPQVGW